MLNITQNIFTIIDYKNVSERLGKSLKNAYEGVHFY